MTQEIDPRDEQFGTPAEPKPRKSRRVLVWVIAAVLVVALAVGSTLFILKDKIWGNGLATMGETVEGAGPFNITVFEVRTGTVATGSRWVAADVQVCVKEVDAGSYLTPAPWRFIDAKRRYFVPLERPITSEATPAYPARQQVVSGDCVRGWINAGIEGAEAITTVRYQRENFAQEWAVP